MAVKEKVGNFIAKRAEKKAAGLERKHSKEAVKMEPEIGDEIESQYATIDVDSAEFVADRTTFVQDRLTELNNKSDLSDEDKAEHALLTDEEARLNLVASPEAERDFYLDAKISVAADDHAEQIAARMDETVNLKNGTHKLVDETYKAWRVATGLKIRNVVDQLPAGATDLDKREAELMAQLGDPTDPDDLGIKGQLNEKVAERRKLRGGLYERQVDETTGAVTVERNKKGILREAFGRVWRNWSEQGPKGKLKKLAVGVAIGGVAALLGGAIGAGTVAAGLAVGTVRVLKGAGTAVVERAGDRSAADEDLEAWQNSLREERGIRFAQAQAGEEAGAPDEILRSSRDRAHNLNATHKKTTLAMGAAALIPGLGIARGMADFMPGTGAGGIVGNGITDNFSGLKKGFNSINPWGPDDVNASGPNSNPGNTGNSGDSNKGDTGIEPRVQAQEPDGGKNGIDSRDPQAQAEAKAEADKQVTDAKVAEAKAKAGQLDEYDPANPYGTNEAALDGTAASPEHVVTGAEMDGKWVEQVYVAEGLTPTDYMNHAQGAMNNGELTQVTNPNGSFHYRVSTEAMGNLGLKGDPTSTENVMKVLATHSEGKIRIDA